MPVALQAQQSGGSSFLVDENFVDYTAENLEFVRDNNWAGFLQFLLENHPPNTPTLISPEDGGNASTTLTLEASEFSDSDKNTQANSQWQVALDSNFSRVVWDSGENGPALNWIRIPRNIIENDKVYHWRVRYKDNSKDAPTEWSNWSESWTFNTIVDTDKDGLTDEEEQRLGTHPEVADSDGDGLSDSLEVALGSDPTDANSVAVKLKGNGPISINTETKTTNQFVKNSLAAIQAETDSISHTLTVNGSAYQIRSVSYQPTPVGEDPGMVDYNPYRQDLYDRDLPLIRAMGANTIRTLGKINNNDGFLDACWNSGINPIRVIAEFPVDLTLDLNDEDTQEVVLSDFKDFVKEFKNHPAILMWLPGGELNYHFRDDPGKLRSWFTLLNALGWAAFEIEGTNYHPVTTDFAADSWNGLGYDRNLVTDHMGIAELFSDDAHLTGLDIWGFNSYRGTTFDVPGEKTNLFLNYTEVSSKPMWISEFGIDAWDQKTGMEDQLVQTEGVSSLWNEIDENQTICLGGSVKEYSDEWWTNDVANNPNAQDTGPFERGDQPDGWSDEEYYGLVSISPQSGGADIVTPRQAYFAVGNAFGVNWAPASNWGASPVEGQWYSGRVHLEAVVTDPDGAGTIRRVEFEYSLDSTDGTDGEWNPAGSALSIPPFAMDWDSEVVNGVDSDVWLRVRAFDDSGGISKHVVRQIRVDNSFENVIFTPHPGAVDIPFDVQPSLTFNTPIRKGDGAEILSGDLQEIIALTKGDETVPFTASINAGKTVVTIVPGQALEIFTNYSLSLISDVMNDGDTILPHSTSNFRTADGPPEKLAFFRQPGGGEAGLAWDRQPAVMVTDIRGNLVAEGTFTVDLSAESQSTALNGTVSVETVNGVGQFEDLSINLTGEHQLRAQASGIGSATSSPFTITSGPIDHFIIGDVPGTTMSGTTLSPTITAVDEFNNVKTDYLGIPEFVSSDSRALLPSFYQFRDHENGIHTYLERLTLLSTGEQEVKLIDGTAESDPVFITVTNAPPDKPEAVDPVNGKLTDLTPALSASTYIDIDQANHAASHWQIAADPGFTDIVWDFGDAAGTTSVEVPAGVLEQRREYYWRVRYKDDSGDSTTEWSDWSEVPDTGPMFVTSFALPFLDDFSADKGWTGYKTGFWERGAATAGGGENGFPDPAEDASSTDDNMLLGFAIGDDYPVELSETTITSPVVDCTGQNVVELRFQRWLGLDGNQWARASVDVTNDGVTWTPVWKNSADEISDDAWKEVTLDISHIAGDQSQVQVRFTIGPMFNALPYAGWNIDDVELRAGEGRMAEVILETDANEVRVGDEFDVRIYVQENTSEADGFRGGPLDFHFSADTVGYSEVFSSAAVIQPPFNSLQTNGVLREGVVDELGGVTIQEGVGDSAPALYAILKFIALAPGTAEFQAMAGESGFSLAPPVGQITTSRIFYGDPVTVTIQPAIPVPLIEVTLQGPDGVFIGAEFEIDVFVKENSEEATGFLGGPMDILFDSQNVSYSGEFKPEDIIQPPFDSVGIFNGSLETNRVNELGGATIKSGHGDSEAVLYARLSFIAETAGSARFSASPGETGLSLTQPVGLVSQNLISYGDPIELEISSAPVAKLEDLPEIKSNEAFALIEVSGIAISHYKYRLDDDSFSEFIGIDQPIDLSELADGGHTLFVLGRTSEGLEQPGDSPTTYTWIIDTVPPNAPEIAVESPTKMTQPVWSWSTTQNESTLYRYQLDGEEGGQWTETMGTSFIPPEPFADGESHTLYVQEGDDAGNWSKSGFQSTLIDLSGPLPGRVRDGIAGDSNTQSSATSISANWNGFSDMGSGIASYEWTIGTNPGGTDVQDWTNVGKQTTATTDSLELDQQRRYYVAVRGIDQLGNMGQPAVSDGVIVVASGLSISATNSSVNRVSFGHLPDVTDGFDPSVDTGVNVDSVPDEAMIFLVNAVIVDPEPMKLTSDFRPEQETTRWRLMVEMPGPSMESVLTWDVSTADPGKSLLLQRLEGEIPIGRPIDLKSESSLMVSKDAVYEIAYAPESEAMISFENDWNVLSVPVMTVQSIADLFYGEISEGDFNSPIWHWDGNLFKAISMFEPLNPERAYWINVENLANQTEEVVVTGIPADGMISLINGWNFISVVQESAVPDVPEIKGKIWWWDSEEQRLKILGDNENLIPGRGYWIYSTKKINVVF